MADLTTLIFIPGSWHKPTCYQKIIDTLSKKSHVRCVTITLPSTEGDPAATFKDDIDVARAAISQETDHGRCVVVIAHSYGGMVGNSAIKGFTRPFTSVGDAAASPTGHVIGLVLIASGFTLTGLSFMDPLFGIPPPSWRVNKETGFAELVTPPRELFYHDLPADEAEFAVSKLTPQSLKALFEGGEYAYAGWRDVPTWYIGTIEDRGLPVVMQRMQVGMARGMGATVEHRELQTSHSPFLSQPKEVVKILLEAIDSFTGKVQTMATREQRTEGRISVPAVRLWQAYSWIRFGLPLTFGRVIGTVILCFTWVKSCLRP